MAIGPLEAKDKVCLYSVIIIINDSIQFISVAVVITVVAAVVTLLFLLRTHKKLDLVHSFRCLEFIVFLCTVIHTSCLLTVGLLHCTLDQSQHHLA